MRSKMIEHDWVEAVIGLGPNLFYNSPMESCIVVCNRRKPQARKGRVLFIDALSEVTRERAQSFLTPAHQQRIVATFRTGNDEPGFSALATNRGLGLRRSRPVALRIVDPRLKRRAGPCGGTATQTDWSWKA